MRAFIIIGGERLKQTSLRRARKRGGGNRLVWALRRARKRGGGNELVWALDSGGELCVESSPMVGEWCKLNAF